MSSAPCTVWAARSDMPAQLSDPAVNTATIDAALDYASVILFNLTKRRWSGLCSDTFRPLGNDACFGCGVSYASLIAAGATGESLSRSGMGVDQFHSALRLPVVKVRAITSVKINNAIIDPATYEIRDGNKLWRKIDTAAQGQTMWPCWQDLHRADTDTKDTFVVAYTYGIDPPPAMVRACSLLAWEFAVAWTPDCTTQCKLPRNVTSVSRGGVTTTFPDPASLFENGKTHVPEVDMLVAAVNRGDARARPMVAVPGETQRGSRR